MKRISLHWYGPDGVAELYENLKRPLSFSDDKYPYLNTQGFYMYLNQNQTKAIYIGQAFSSKSARPLRNRIRWEITKDGMGCALSQFSKDCQEFGIDKFSLVLKVAHVKESTDNGNSMHEYNPSDIEMALICERSPLINRSGKKRYRKESIEISNNGNFAPLPKTFRKVTGERCIEKQDLHSQCINL